MSTMKQKPPLEYVTCAICGQRYAGKTPKGGDGSILYPRKHARFSRWRGMRTEEERYCPGSYEAAKEYAN